MFNLVQLLLKLSGFLLFIVLETICFSLVVRYNSNQEKVYTNTVNQFTGWMQKKIPACSTASPMKESIWKIHWTPFGQIRYSPSTVFWRHRSSGIPSIKTTTI